MPLQDMDHNELQQTLAQLDRALYNHQQWHNDLIRTMVCRLPCNKHDIIPEAHKECRFGQWYYSDQSKNMNGIPDFVSIGEAHQHMHQALAQALINLNINGSIATSDYDNFANSLERFRLEMFAFKNKVEILLYNRDPLTMTINRADMLPILREQQELTNRQLQSCCLAMIDLDLFKKVNDQYGHLIGDKVLAILAHYITAHLRSYDKIFRFGGEEFLLCIPHITLSEASEMVDRIREGIASMAFNVGLQDPIHITVSCGITLLEPNFTVEQSIDHADKALYLAKSSGRNQSKVWNAQIAENE